MQMMYEVLENIESSNPPYNSFTDQNVEWDTTPIGNAYRHMMREK